jgi:S-adenosylmethionine:tRNA ribosyltransferase-isomerase
VVDGLLTNFHQPRSSLLVMVSAFFGTETVRTAYQQALAWGYRFLSFGDCMFGWRAI